jgi:acyl transferase domain-containing protein
MAAETKCEVANGCASGHSLDRLVLLRPMEVVTLVHAMRDRAHRARLMAEDMKNVELRAACLLAAADLEARASEIAQEND